MTPRLPFTIQEVKLAQGTIITAFFSSSRSTRLGACAKFQVIFVSGRRRGGRCILEKRGEGSEIEWIHVKFYKGELSKSRGGRKEGRRRRTRVNAKTKDLRFGIKGNVWVLYRRRDGLCGARWGPPGRTKLVCELLNLKDMREEYTKVPMKMRVTGKEERVCVSSKSPGVKRRGPLARNMVSQAPNLVR